LETFGTKAVGVYLINNRVLPPCFGLLAKACPAGACEHLGRGGKSDDAGEAEGQKSFGSGNRHVREMLSRVIPCYKNLMRVRDGLLRKIVCVVFLNGYCDYTFRVNERCL